MGVSVTDTMPEIRIATQMVTANSRNSRPRMPPRNSTGMNTAASDSVIETMVKPISFDPTSAAYSGFFAHLHVAENVFQHHDGVVHHEADRKNQRHHRQVVQAVVQQVHDGERSDDRERQGQAGNHGGRDVAQEQEDHHHHQAERQQHGELDVFVGLANGVGAVVQDVHVHRRRESRRGRSAAGS